MAVAPGSQQHDISMHTIVEPGDLVGEMQLELNILAHSFSRALDCIQRDTARPTSANAADMV